MDVFTFVSRSALIRPREEILTLIEPCGELSLPVAGQRPRHRHGPSKLGQCYWSAAGAQHSQRDDVTRTMTTDEVRSLFRFFTSSERDKEVSFFALKEREMV